MSTQDSICKNCGAITKNAKRCEYCGTKSQAAQTPNPAAQQHKPRKRNSANAGTCIIAGIAVLLYLISIVLAFLRGDILQAFPLALITMLIEDAPFTDMLMPAVHMGLFIGAAWLFVTNLSAFKR